MKKAILIILMIGGLNSLFGQKLFYQYKGVLVKNGKEVKVSFQDSIYNVYDGIVSLKGNYVSGYLFEGVLKERVEYQRETGGIIDYPDVANMIFIIYSCKDNKILYIDTLEFGTDVIFSANENYVLLPFYYVDEISSKLVNLENGKIEYEFIEGCRDFKWINNELYFLLDAFKNTEYIFCRYNKKEKKIDEIYSISREKTCKTFDDYSFEVIDSLRILFIYKTEEGTWLKLIEKDKILTLFGSKNLNIEHANEDNVLFSANRSNQDNWTLYLLDMKDYSISKLFSLSDIIKYLPNNWSLGYSFPFRYKQDIYFISGIPENIVKYNIPTKKFLLVTKKGYISAPIGYYEK